MRKRKKMRRARKKMRRTRKERMRRTLGVKKKAEESKEKAR